MKFKRVKIATANVESRHFGRSLVFGAKLEDGELEGEVSVARMRTHIRKIHDNSALAIARRQANPAVKYAAAPRRHAKGVMEMASRGHRVSYQGMDDSGHPVWS